jgi:hypothetical protein
MGFTGTVRLAGAACVGLLLAVSTTQARSDASLDDFFSEYRALAFSPKTLLVFPMPLCGGGDATVPLVFGTHSGGDGFTDLLFVSADLAGQIRLTVEEPTTGRTIRQFLVAWREARAP